MHMAEVTVVIPNYNGIGYLKDCLDTLREQTCKNYETVLVDNGSTDGSLAFVKEHYPWVKILALDRNYGFCHAVNAGIRAAESSYVFLLNNDTKLHEDCIEELLIMMRQHPHCFSCSARMIKMHEPDKLDDAGDYYCALGWAYALGKDRPWKDYLKPRKVFAACGGASMYRRSVFEKIGRFDEAHFAYLEDIDVGYRAQIYGYENWYCPRAVVWHVGSGTSGSRYNEFKVRHSSRNNVYMIYKNMIDLAIPSVDNVVKVGDTIADIKEGVNAKVWSVGIVTGSNEMGLTEEEYNHRSSDELIELKREVRERMLNAGAHFVLDNIMELPSCIEKINGKY